MGTQADEPVVRLLSDEPATTDSFGGHDRVAQAMADLICGEDGGHAVALLGPWGSGKSTVIRLLTDRLDRRKDRSAGVFVFDAWAHEGNPLRVTFLEALVSYLKGRKPRWICCYPWRARLDELKQRLETIEKTETPVLQPLGVVALFLLLFVTPLGTLLLKEAVQRSAAGQAQAPWLLLGATALLLSPLVPIWLTWFAQRGVGHLARSTRLLVALVVVLAVQVGGTALCAAPLASGTWVQLLRDVWPRAAALLIGAVALLVTWSHVRREACPNPAAPTRGAERDARGLWALLLQRSVVQSHSQVVKTPEPTSVEFRREFETAMAEALGDGDARRLVIVIDNLDRVDKGDAVRLWATMQTFFEPLTGKREPPPWHKRLWLVVPFAPEGIEHLWSADGGDSADHFASKTFQAVFHVPPPLLSGWRNYLAGRVAEAIPALAGETEDLQRIGAVYGWAHARCAKDRTEREALLRKPDPEEESWAARCARELEIPTPREITRFANQLAALHLKWHRADPEIPLMAVAAYASLAACRGIGASLSDLVDPTGGDVLADTNLRRHVGGDPLPHFARIHYLEPDPEKAMQIALGPEVESALRSEDVGEFLRLSTVPGFWPVLDERIGEWAGDGGLLIGAARVLAAVEPSDDDGRAGARQAWRHLASSVPGTTWQRPTADLGAALATILDHAPADVDRGRVVAAVARLPVEANHATEWAQGAAGFIRTLDLAGYGVLLGAHFAVTYADPTAAVLVLSELGAAVDQPGLWTCCANSGADVVAALQAAGRTPTSASTPANPRAAAPSATPSLNVCHVARAIPVLAAAGAGAALASDLAPPLRDLLNAEDAPSGSAAWAVLGLLRLRTVDRELIDKAIADRRARPRYAAGLWEGVDETSPPETLCAAVAFDGLTHAGPGPARNTALQRARDATAAPDTTPGGLAEWLAREAELIGAAEWLLPYAAVDCWLGRACSEALRAVAADWPDLIEFENYSDGYDLVAGSGLDPSAVAQVVRAAVRDGDLCATLAAAGFDLGQVALYRCALDQADGDVRQAFAGFLGQGLAGLDVDGWRDIVWDCSVVAGPLADVAHLVLAVGGPGGSPPLAALYGGILAASAQLFAGPDPGPDGSVPMTELLALLPADQRVACLTKLHDDQGKRAGDAPMGWLAVFGPALLHPELDERDVDAVVLGALTHLAGHARDPAACRWLIGAVSGPERPLSRCRRQVAATFADRLPAVLAERDPDDLWTPAVRQELMSVVAEHAPKRRSPTKARPVAPPPS